MMADQSLEDVYRQRLIARLGEIGIAANRLRITYEDYLQDHEIIIDQDLSPEQMNKVAEATWALGIVTLTEPLAYQAYMQISDVVMIEIQSGERLVDAEKRKRPVFGGGHQTITDYAAKLEDWCGRDRGTLFSIQGDGGVLAIPGIGLPLDASQREFSSRMKLSEILGAQFRYAVPNS